MELKKIREVFLNFFKNYGHAVVPSSSLIPSNDPSLLFTNSGMVQFKDVFLGREKRPYSRATTVQRCLRAGGKHNDLENVGYTARHHTFFEMLGNFSFGDYFKREAIEFAWTFLTKELEIPVEKLWVTVYQDDPESEAIWLNEIKVDPRRFSRCGKEDNFWMMGDTGPCGPCTEIFYDHGPAVWGGPPGTPDSHGDRYVEIWNLVFMQYERDSQGNLQNLPLPSVDTGMGLERLAAVMQGVHSNYDIDLFKRLIKKAAKIMDVDALDSPSLRVIADHIRSTSFLITDGVLPSNEGRGYVLRRIIRRASRHGHKLGTRDPFLYKLVDELCHEMGEAYPELVVAQQTIKDVILQEENQFAKTLEQGLKILEHELHCLKQPVIPGEVVFKLYDTYGFPIDLTQDIAREFDYKIDMAGFEAAMHKQREQSQQHAAFYAKEIGTIVGDLDSKTEFVGYESLLTSGDKIEAIYNATNDKVPSLGKNESGIIILAKTPFYAESGGQVSDTGILKGRSGTFAVENTQKQGDLYLHYGKISEGNLAAGDVVVAQVDIRRRRNISLNHSATHLLHAALRKIIGKQVVQKGSYVGPDYLRFDFAYHKPLTKQESQEVAELVNQQIIADIPVETKEMSLDDALKSGALGLFTEKYTEKVRVLNMGVGFSVELCGGTHVKSTGNIGVFAIVNESAVASGIRRIEAVTGEAAVRYFQERDYLVRELAQILQVANSGIVNKVKGLLDNQRALEKENQRYKAKQATQDSSSLAEQAEDLMGIKLLVCKLGNQPIKELRDTIDHLKNKLGQAVIVLASNSDGKVNLVVGVTATVSNLINAGDLAKHIAAQIGGSGGGRAELAQAGGTDLAQLDSALASVRDLVQVKLSGQ